MVFHLWTICGGFNFKSFIHRVDGYKCNHHTLGHVKRVFFAERFKILPSKVRLNAKFHSNI